MICDNVHEVEQRIINACRRSNRKREDVILIAVSKTKPISMIDEVIKTGIVNLGENKVQELCDKYEAFNNQDNMLKLEWHMIGHLQRNKVKYIIGKTAIIHSVDSYRLAEQIQNEAEKKGCICNILIEVNIADEKNKYGVMESETENLIRQVSVFKNICIRGLMTVAPYTEDGENNRLYFHKMNELCVDIKNKNIDNVSMDVLSMGMTNDYETAIEEGATHIRVGTGIFGERDYNN